MEDSDYITIYWAPSTFTKDEEQWTQIYKSPKSLSSLLRDQKIDDINKKTSNAFACPASNNLYKNIFVFNHAFDASFSISKEESFYIYENSNSFNYPFYLENRTSLSLKITRKPSFKDHINFVYNMGWLFFANEPVKARFTAPYMPPFSPMKNGMLSSGEFDIGKWYRDYVLDYQVPIGDINFEFKKNDPMFYLEIFTNKKVQFKRYFLTKTLQNLAKESAESSMRYGKFKSLDERYEMSVDSFVPQQILKEIQNNLID